MDPPGPIGGLQPGDLPFLTEMEDSRDALPFVAQCRLCRVCICRTAGSKASDKCNFCFVMTKDAAAFAYNKNGVVHAGQAAEHLLHHSLILAQQKHDGRAPKDSGGKDGCCKAGPYT